MESDTLDKTRQYFLGRWFLRGLHLGYLGYRCWRQPPPGGVPCPVLEQLCGCVRPPEHRQFHRPELTRPNPRSRLVTAQSTAATPTTSGAAHRALLRADRVWRCRTACRPVNACQRVTAAWTYCAGQSPAACGSCDRERPTATAVETRQRSSSVERRPSRESVRPFIFVSGACRPSSGYLRLSWQSLRGRLF